MSQKYDLYFGHQLPELRILIAWSGEPQILEALASLKKYCICSRKSVQVVIFFGFSNLKVHQLIYSEVNTSNVPCVKLDGDMTITDMKLFFKMALNQTARSITIFKVRCHIVKKRIYGIHFFSTEVNDLVNSNKLFPDQYSGKYDLLTDQSNNIFVSHCLNPSKEQICNFVGHRLRKLVRSKFTRLDYLPMLLRATFWYPLTVLSGLPNIYSMVILENYKEAFQNDIIERKIDLDNFIEEQDLAKEK